MAASTSEMERSHSPPSGSAFIAAGGFDALKACASDVVVSPRKVGPDPYEDIFVDVFFNFRPGYEGNDFGEKDVPALSSNGTRPALPSTIVPGVARKSSSVIERSDEQNDPAEDEKERYIQQSANAESNGADAGHPEEGQASNSKTMASMIAEQGTSSVDCDTQTYSDDTAFESLTNNGGAKIVPPNDAGEEIKSFLLNEPGAHCYDSNGLKSVPNTPTGILSSKQETASLRKNSLTSSREYKSAAGAMADDMSKKITTPGSKVELLSLPDNTQALQEQRLPTRDQDFLSDHLWISRTDAIGNLIKKESLVKQGSNKLSDVVTPATAATLAKFEDNVRTEEASDAFVNVTAARGISGGTHHVQRLYDMDMDKPCKGIETDFQVSGDVFAGKEKMQTIRTPQTREYRSLENKMKSSVDVGPTAFTMDGFESTAGSSSQVSTIDHAVRDLGTGLNPINADKNKRVSGPMDHARRELPAELAEGKMEENPKREDAQAKTESKSAQKTKGPQASEDRNQTGCGLLRQSSLRGVIKTLRRTLSRDNSASEVEGSTPEASEHEIFEEEAHDEVPGTENYSEQSTDEKDETSVTALNEMDAAGNISAHDGDDVLPSESTPNADGTTHGIEIPKVAEDVRKLHHKLSMKKTLGALRKIGSKDKRPPRESASVAPNQLSRRDESAPGNPPRQNFLTRLLSRSKSRDVAGNLS